MSEKQLRPVRAKFGFVFQDPATSLNPRLRVGDCVEVQQNERVPGDPDTSYINIYRTPCQVRDGVARVDQIVSSESQCGGSLMLFNTNQFLYLE